MAPLRPLLASFLALLWVTAPLTPQLHLLLVQHSVCPEHGELTEEGSYGAEGAQQQDAHEHFVGAVLASTTVHDEGHDHSCAFLLAPSPNLGSEIALLVQPHAFNFPSLQLGDVSAPRAPPLSFAPKTSPPRS